MKHPIFDFDGTILDSLAGGPKLFLSVAEMMGLNHGFEKEQQLRAQWGSPIATLIPLCWPTADFVTFFSNLKVAETTHLHPLFPEVKDLLELLGRSRVVSILTSRQRESMEMHLEHHNIRDHFRFCYPVEEHPKPKPDPASILPLLAQYALRGIQTSSLVLIGDSVHSDFALISKLQTVGVVIGFIGVTWGASTRSQFLEAGVPQGQIADSVGQLNELLMLE